MTPPAKKSRVSGSSSSSSSNMVTIQVDQNVSSSSVDGPILVTNSSPDLPSDLTFNLYKSTQLPTSSTHSSTKSNKKRKLILAAENEKFEFVGQSMDEKDAGFYCKYLVGVVNNRTKTISFQHAPIMRITRTVKSLKPTSDTPTPARLKNMQARNALGEAFGTKKRKQEIKALEKNRIDVESLAGVANILKTTVDAKAKDIPTQDEIHQEMWASLPLPPYDKDATRPEEIYKLTDLIPSEPFKLIPHKLITEMETKSDLDQFIKSLRIPTYISTKLISVFPSRKEKSIWPLLKRLIYMAYLFAFRSIRNVNKDVSSRLIDCPEGLIQYLCTNFTEERIDPLTSASIKTITPKCKDKIQAYYLALALHLDSFTLDIATISKEFSLAAGKMMAFVRAMGCTMQNYTAEEKRVRGIPKNSMLKKAVLTAPLKLPVPSNGPGK